MDVFLQVQRRKTTLFIYAKDNMKVSKVKSIITDIFKKPSQDQRLLTEDDVVMEDSKTLAEYGYSSAICKPQSPGSVKLSLRTESGEFEPFDVVSYSAPPDLPYVMKNHDSAATGSD